MARAFSTQEKERIADHLKIVGRDFFTRFGLRKTSIGDLTRQVGIAQGSFYQFYESKEQLYFSILEEEEVKMRTYLMGFLPTNEPLKAEDLERMLMAGYEAAKTNSLMMQLISGEAYQDLIARLPSHLLDNHTHNDQEQLLPLVKHWQSEGTMIDENPIAIAGVLRAVFLLILHERELGRDSMPDIFRLLIRLISRGLCP